MNDGRYLLVTVPSMGREDFGAGTSQKTCLRLQKPTFGSKVDE